MTFSNLCRYCMGQSIKHNYGIPHNWTLEEVVFIEDPHFNEKTCADTEDGLEKIYTFWKNPITRDIRTVLEEKDAN